MLYKICKVVSEMAPACTSLIHLNTELQPASTYTCACCQNLWPDVRAAAHACKGSYLRVLPEGGARGLPCCVCNMTVKGAICGCRAKSKKHDQAHTMNATLAALEAPAPPPVICSPPAARQGASQAPVEPLQPSTSARVNSHKESDSGGMRTRSRAHREASPNGRDTVSFTSRHLGANSEATQKPCKAARVNSCIESDSGDMPMRTTA